MTPRIAAFGGIRYLEYRFPSARDARRFIKDKGLDGRFDLSARINVDPPTERRDLYKKARGAVYVPVWSVEGEELRFLTRLLRKETEIIKLRTPTESIILRIAEASDHDWRLVADGTVKRQRPPSPLHARLEELL